MSAGKLAELATFIRERDNAAADRQIDTDFAEGGRLSTVAEEVLVFIGETPQRF
ncbi:MAG: hypothetical protein H0X40_01795 [Chthoniobacterales bacterium]|nr:hypothetical protein [Chthoniobacterales bacterium]